jgi:transcriptional regulator with XRE-family HTH domain
MPPQEHATFGERLRAALEAAGGMKQVDLARALHMDASQVNRWVHNKSRPVLGTVQEIDQILGSSLATELPRLAPEYELFVSAPITGLAEGQMAAHHDKVARVVDAAQQHVNGLYWPGQDIRSADDLRAADLATEHNFQALDKCPAFLYLQFANIVHPSSALVEFGFALGRKMKTTFIIEYGLSTPYMLYGFRSVASNLSFLPNARIYPVNSVDEAVTLIARDGRELLGLT